MRWLATAATALLMVMAPVAVAASPPAALAVQVTPTSSSAAAGQFVGFQVRVTDGSGILLSVTIDYADGSSSETVRGRAMCRPGRTAGGLDVAYDFSHAYRRGAVYPVSVTAMTSSCDGAPAETAVGAAAPIVLPGLTPNNGPRAVEADGSEVTPTAQGTAVEVYGRDADGFVTQMQVTWGDGSSWRRVYDRADCVDPLLHWPTSSSGVVRLSHRYPDTKKRTVTVTTTSAGCDGTAVQVARHTFRVDPAHRETKQGGLGGASTGPVS